MTRTFGCIAAIWMAGGAAFALGVGQSAVVVFAVLYIVGGCLMFLRYKTSSFGRTWIPRLLGQYFDWPPLARLRRVVPPFGPLLGNAVAIALAAHVPLILWFGIPSVMMEAVV